MYWQKGFIVVYAALIISNSVQSQILVYNNTNPSPDSGFFSFDPAAEMGLQDYVLDTSLLEFDSCLIISMNFVGGLSEPGQMRVEFLNEDTSRVSSWLFNLQAGNFNYNLSFDSVPIPEKGYVRVSSLENTGGQWFLNKPTYQVGSQDTNGVSMVDDLKLIYALGIQCAGEKLDCPEYMNINAATIEAETYIAHSSITCIGTIEASTMVSMIAGRDLRTGSFAVRLGGELEMYIQTCANE